MNFSLTDNLYLLNLDSLAGGDHLFRAVAYDLGGLSSASEVVAVSVNFIPKIKILQPLDSTEFTGQDSVRLEFTLEDENIQDVKIYLNEVLLSSPTCHPKTIR